MDRRSFVVAAVAAPFALRAAPRPPLAYVTADTEAHIAVVDLRAAVVRKRIAVTPGPRSVEQVGSAAVVCHTVSGVVTVLEGLAVKHVLHGFEEPRYAAAAPDGRHAFVTDSGRADLATVDVVRGRVVARLKLKQWPRHLAISDDGRTVWVGLGTAAPEVAVVDVRDPLRPRLLRYVRPGFLAHDVGITPHGDVWITSGNEPTIAVHRNRSFHRLAADRAPQHVTFLAGRAFVTSGAAATLRVYDQRTLEQVRQTEVPVGSYNVQRADGLVLTPSLDAGTLCILDGLGRMRHSVRVASSSHDACLARA